MCKEKILKIISGEDVSTTKNEMFSIIRDCKHENEVLQDVNERYIKLIKELREKNEKLGEELAECKRKNDSLKNDNEQLESDVRNIGANSDHWHETYVETKKHRDFYQNAYNEEVILALKMQKEIGELKEKIIELVMNTEF